MKSRAVLLRIVLSIAAALVIAAAVVAELDLEPSVGTAVTAAFLALLASVSILYVLVVRPVSRLAEERATLSRKSAELEILKAVGADAIEGVDPEEMVRKTAGEMRRLFEVPRCIVWLFGSPDTIVDDRIPGLPSAEASLPVVANPEYWKDACRSGQTAAVDDVRQSPAFRASGSDMELLKIRSFLGVPLCVPQGPPVGVLFLCRTEPGRWSPQASRAAEAIGRQLAGAVGHLREFRDSKAFSASLLSLMDHVPGMVYRGQRDWSLSVASAEVEKMTGYPPKDFLNGNVRWKNLIHPEDLEMVKQTFRSAVQSRRKVLRVEYRARHRNGSWRWLADRRQLIYDDLGRFLYVDGLCLDITDRKKGEAGSAVATGR